MNLRKYEKRNKNHRLIRWFFLFCRRNGVTLFIKAQKMFLFLTKEAVVYFCVTKSTKSQKEEGINSCLGDADTHAARMCQFLF